MAGMPVDLPRRGVARDYAAWVTRPENKYAEGIVMSGYLARLHPDVRARAHSLCGEPVPGPLRRRDSFAATGVPEEARHFAVRSFDDSNNRSRTGNVAAAERR